MIPKLENFFAWPLFVLSGLVLLPGRYDWSRPARSASLTAFLCSGFFFCLLIPLAATALERFAVRPLWRNSVLAGMTLFFTLPYRWLGLDRWAFHRNRPDWFDWHAGGQPKLIWFPQAFWQPAQIPHELLFFALMTAALGAIGWWYVAQRRRAWTPIDRFTLGFGAAVILLVIVETWMHLSLRSPYTYICHFERPASANYWYHVLLFANGQGAVNADYFVFRGLEDIFMGAQHAVNGMMIRRPFPFYLSSQLSYFINAYYVMLASNILVWVLAVLAFRDYVAAHFGRGTAAVAALLAASGPGFLMFAAQPQTYLWGYSVGALIIWAHWRICGKSEAGWRDYLFFGGLLSLALLTYDLAALLLYFFGYELLFKRSIWKMALAAALALAIYAAFGLLTTPMKSFVHDPANIHYFRLSVTNTIAALRTNPISLKSYYSLYTGLLPNYVWNLGNAVFVFPLLVAAIGFFCLDNPVKLKLIGLLFLPSVAGVMFLYLGQTYIATLPRFAFIGYPAVYILCGAALWKATRALGARWKPAMLAVPLIGVAAHIVLVNADVFGYPWLYYLLYYQNLAPANF